MPADKVPKTKYSIKYSIKYVLPFKKKRKSELSDEEKKYNRKHSKLRELKKSDEILSIISLLYATKRFEFLDT
jgi:hypothetical protein